MSQTSDHKEEIQQKNLHRGTYKKVVISEQHQFYNPIYTKITGTIPSGLLLSKIMYHSSGNINEGIYYTDKSLCKDLSMGIYQLYRAKKKLTSLGVATIKRCGIPAKTKYKINTNLLIDLVEKSVSTK